MKEASKKMGVVSAFGSRSKSVGSALMAKAAAAATDAKANGDDG